MCAYNPDCPNTEAREAFTAHVIAPHPEQGWCLLCDGAILFDDGGVILPDGSIREPGMAAA